jgi:exosortase/archaeosortase family protein
MGLEAPPFAGRRPRGGQRVSCIFPSHGGSQALRPSSCSHEREFVEIDTPRTHVRGTISLPRWSVLLGMIAVFWPMLPWWAGRTVDGSDGSWNLLAVLALLAMTPWRAFLKPTGETALIRLCILLALALPFLAVGTLPPLAKGLMAAGLLAVLWRDAGASPAVSLLPLLSLPLLATADFYLGYPLRLLVAEGSGILLQIFGWPVEVSGVGLTWEGRQVLVDAPCSGLKMLWFGAWMTLVAAGLCRLNWASLFRLSATALLLLIGLNIVRATVLFFPESGLLTLSSGWHEAIGGVFFFLAGGGILMAAQQFQQVQMSKGIFCRAAPPEADCRRVDKTAAGDCLVTASSGTRPRGRPTGDPARIAKIPLLYLLLCLLGFAATWIPRTGAADATSSTMTFPGWPHQWEGQEIEPLPLSAKEARFLQGFPGQTGSFSDRDGKWILRWVTEPTRRLHPARHCFAGSGYDIQPRGLVRDGWEKDWGCFEARQGGTAWQVRERITDAAGNSWTDVSAWYWSATLGRTRGPWWVQTRILPITQ